jgi:hypothetical protein
MGASPAGRAVTLLADADLDVRGRSALPDVTVLEVLVGRLSRLGSVRDRALPGVGGPPRGGGPSSSETTPTAVTSWRRPSWC